MSREQAETAKTGIYFISDAHLGLKVPGGEGREAALISFLRKIAPRAAHLFIVGDLFDFWIEYRHAIRPEYFPVVHELRCLVEGGTQVHYCLGNHDFAAGPFLENVIGLKLHPDELEMTLQGKKLLILHGDGLRPREAAYRVLRRILRSPLVHRLYKILHPNLGVPLADFFSGLSRRFSEEGMNPRLLMEYRSLARNLLENGADVVVLGHTHQPELTRFAGKVYCNTGAWLRRYPFAELKDGEISLRFYTPGKEL